MNKKTCFKCKKEMPENNFYKHSGMKDGRLNKCKECAKLDSRMVRTANIEHYREYDMKRWAEKGNRRIRKRTKSSEMSIAHNRVKKAVDSGKLTKSKFCVGCGDRGRIEGHHEDYSKPLDVLWLCTGCHSFIHNMEKFKL